MPKIKIIDNEEEHNKVLYELRILDDDDDYPLFCKMRDNDSYDTQEFSVDAEVELYIIENELYKVRYDNLSHEYIYLKNHETNEIHIMAQQIYMNTQNMLWLEKKLIFKDTNIQVNKI